MLTCCVAGGGSNTYNIYLTGTELSVSTLSSGQAPTNTATNTDTSTASLAVITEAGKTIVVTASSQTNSQSSSSSGPNTVGLAVGVVTGVLALAAIVGAAFFFIRRQRRRAVEAAYRRNAASYAPSKTLSASSVNDSRWDGDYMAQRRQSNGSIADDEDFSRRILKVGGPQITQSVMVNLLTAAPGHQPRSVIILALNFSFKCASWRDNEPFKLQFIMITLHLETSLDIFLAFLLSCSSPYLNDEVLPTLPAGVMTIESTRQFPVYYLVLPLGLERLDQMLGQVLPLPPGSSGSDGELCMMREVPCALPTLPV
jgi:hypothetical protein